MAHHHRLSDPLGLKMSDLKSFLSSYFHEDFYLEAPNPDGNIDLFLRSNPDTDQVNRIVRQIEDYLSSRDDAAIDAGLFKELGCYYWPGADGMSAKVWLLHVAERLKKG